MNNINKVTHIKNPSQKLLDLMEKLRMEAEKRREELIKKYNKQLK